MKITFQNPTKGPLITVSLDDEAAMVSRAFSLIGASRVVTAASDGLATLRTAAQFAETAPGATGGAAGGMGIAGPAMFIGMFFAAGDSPQRKLATEEAIQNPMTPAQLRCLADPYNTSAECAAVRGAQLTELPPGTLKSNHNVTRASTDDSPDPFTHTTALILPTEATPVSASECMAVSPAMIEICALAQTKPGSQPAVFALWHYALKHPEWTTYIIGVFIAIIADWRDTFSADPASYLLQRRAVDPQWTRLIMPALIQNADFWLVASYLYGLSEKHPEVFTPEDVAAMVARAASLNAPDEAHGRLGGAYLTSALENLARSRPDLVSVNPILPSHQP
jgi:hypothetical protein